MYYEFYVDVFFVVNLVMDFMLLRLVNRVLKGTATPLRSLAGAALGAAGICVIVLIPVTSPWIRVLLSHGVMNVLMIRVGLGCRRPGRILFGLLLLYGLTFLMGGILTALPESTREDIPAFFFYTAATYWIIVIGMRLFKYLKGKSFAVCEVTIRNGGKSVKVKGLYDTGNKLRDNVTGKPVSVVEYGKFCELLEEKQRNFLEQFMEGKGDSSAIYAADILPLHPHYLKYRSVGQENGMMLAVTVEEIKVSTGEEGKVVKRPVLGIAATSLSTAGNFQIIVNPCILDS